MDNATDLSTKSIVIDSYRFVVSNVKPLTVLLFPPLLFLEAVDLVTDASEGYYSLISAIFSIVFTAASYPIMIVVLVKYVAQRWFQKPVDYRKILTESITVWWPVFQVWLFTGLATLLGLLLLIVPGIWIGLDFRFLCVTL